MSEQDLQRGMEAIDTDAVRAAVATGDVSAAGALELTDEERDLLVAAASEVPEVIGRMIGTGLLGLQSDPEAAHEGTPPMDTHLGG